jgi:phenylacetate-CoA ligase
MNWRKPLIQFLDRYIKGNHIHENLVLLRAFYALPVEEQQRIQEERLTNVLKHAAIHVPYYRQILRDAGVFVDRDINLSRFDQIPLLTKDVLRCKFEQLKSDDLHKRRWCRNASGGSTGEPVTFIQDNMFADLGLATKLLQYEQAGMEIGSTHVKLWGSDRDILKGSIGLRAKVANFIRNRTFLDSFCMSETDMQHYARLVQRLKPVLLEAYSDSAYELARFINNHDLHTSGVGAVITSAGNLYPFMRREIQEAFKCEVLNRYGTREVGDVAFETQSHIGLRVYTYTHLIEVLNENGKMCPIGEEGEIVVTCLSNYAMPFIRYRIGDRAVIGETADRVVSSVQSIQDIVGRVTDSFIKQDGTVISPFFFIHFLGVVHNSGWVVKTQIIQEDYDKIRVKLVVTDPPSTNLLNELENSIRIVMGPECHIKFEFVEGIPPSASGKYRYAISLMSH